MRTVSRILVACFIVLSVDVILLAFTQNKLPKYDLSGNLVDSAVYESGGNVGIGTTSPGWALDVLLSTNGPSVARVNNPNTGSLATSRLVLGMDGLSPNDVNGQIIQNSTTNTAFGGPKSLNIYQYSSAPITAWIGGAERMRIDGSGNVGIGTPSPSAKLSVNGDVTVSGNIAAKYQDVAEWVKASGRVSPRTVVVVRDGEGEANVVQESQRSYDTAVAGVVSSQPGIALGEKGPGRVLVAATGRVRVKVDASYGAIHAGDLLVTSPTPGYGMRSEPVDVGGVKLHRPGTVLGKALEQLDGGKAEILVLLTLQ